MTTILIGAILVGLTLGMLGSGGSVITVPVLVYLLDHGTKESMAESMAIVGMISVAAAIPYAWKKQIDWRSVLFFGLPGMLGTFGGAYLGGHSYGFIQLIVLGAVLILASYFMLRTPSVGEDAEENKVDPNQSPGWLGTIQLFIENNVISAVTFGWPISPERRRAILKAGKIILEGLLVGVVTGFVGVGGGFLIVPALALLAGLPMRLAIGTSLIVIAAKSAVGYFKYQSILSSHGRSADWETILVFAAIGIIASFVGRAINQRLNQQKLKQIFAIFLIVLGGLVMISETVKAIQTAYQPETAEETDENAGHPSLVDEPLDDPGSIPHGAN